MERVVVRDNLARMRAAGYFSILILLFLSVLLTLPLLIFYIPKYGLENVATSMPILPVLIVTFLAELATVALALWYVGALRQWKETLGFINFKWKPIALGLGVGVAFFVGLLILEQAFKAIGIEVSNSDTADTFANLSGLEKYIVLFVGVSILAPLIEELVFRGYVLGFIVKGNQAEDKPLKTPIVVWAIVYSSFLFAILHFQGISNAIDFVVLLWTFLFACASAVLRLKTRSLYPSIAAHCIYNFASALALAFL